MTKKISCVIPFIHEYPSIYMTINHFQSEMLDSEYKWEIVAAENGTQDINTPKAFQYDGNTNNNPLYKVPMNGGLIKYVFDPRQCGPISRNTGARAASGDFVMFCDGHTSFGKNTVDIMANYLEDNPHVGCVTGLTAKSHYDKHRMGAHYEIFHQEMEMQGKGGPTLATHMHGTYMALGRVQGFAGRSADLPYPTVMGSQAYTMYRMRDFWDLEGYLEACRFYPHPEGYMPLKVWMSGKEVHIHPDSWHLHGMYPRQYSQSGPERRKKIREYGGWSWQEHGWRNVMMVAHVLGGDKWRDICYEALQRKHPNSPNMEEMYRTAYEFAEPHRRSLEPKFERTLDEVLIYARKNRFAGMENWDTRVGSDPLG